MIVGVVPSSELDHQFTHHLILFALLGSSVRIPVILIIPYRTNKAEGRQKKCANPLLSFHYYPDGTLLHQDLAAFAILGKNDVHSSLK